MGTSNLKRIRSRNLRDTYKNDIDKTFTKLEKA
jgi:hypothetical protein